MIFILNLILLLSTIIVSITCILSFFITGDFFIFFNSFLDFSLDLLNLLLRFYSTISTLIVLKWDLVFDLFLPLYSLWNCICTGFEIFPHFLVAGSDSYSFIFTDFVKNIILTMSSTAEYGDASFVDQALDHLNNLPADASRSKVLRHASWIVSASESVNAGNFDNIAENILDAFKSIRNPKHLGIVLTDETIMIPSHNSKLSDLLIQGIQGRDLRLNFNQSYVNTVNNILTSAGKSPIGG